MARANEAANGDDSGADINNGGSGNDDSGESGSDINAPGISDSATGSGIDPAAGIGTEPVRKRKRDTIAGSESASRTSGGTSRQKTNKLGLTADGNKIFANQLCAIHEVLGLMTGYGEVMAITPENGESLAAAITEVMGQYKIKPNPKVVAWVNLMGVCAAVYSPKVIMIMAIKKEMARKQAEVRTSINTETPLTSGNVSSMRFD